MVAKPKAKEEVFYTIPELNIRVSNSWLNMIVYCQSTMPYGQLSVEIVNGQPTKVIDKKESIRFDRAPG